MTEKIIIHPILDEIQNQYNNYFHILEPFEDKINNNSQTKYILAFANIMMCYGEEAAFLYNHSWRTSIERIERDFLESYAIVKNLIRLYPYDDDFKEYVRYLYYLDINQTITIIKSIEKDSTFSMNEKQQSISTRLENIKFVIKEFFNEYMADIDENDLRTSVINIFKHIERKCKSGSFDISKSKNIKDALLDNKAWILDAGVPYKGAGIIYGELCHSTHNNISSVIERTVNNGYFMMNTETKNVVPALSLICYCMKDVNLSIKDLFDSI